MHIKLDFVKQLLNYEKEILRRMQNQNSLLVLARGLSIDKILLSLIIPYCDTSELVFILNTTAAEMSRISIECQMANVKNPPLNISELSQKQRMELYEKGGVYYISSQVLILDLLKKQIGRSITGIVVTHAERVLRKKEENFIINLAKFGGLDFVHCLTDAPSVISKDLGRIMASLMVNGLELFPRFHEMVKLDFFKNDSKIDNIEVNLTESMVVLQRIILDLMGKSVKEIKGCGLDLGAYSVESLITWHGLKQWTDHIVQPVWDLLTASSKQAIADLKELKKLAYVLIYSSPVYFYHLAERLKKEHFDKRELGWIEWPEAMELFRLAKTRVFDEKGNKRIETVPKWTVFKLLLEEVKQNASEKKGRGVGIFLKADDVINVSFSLT